MLRTTSYRIGSNPLGFCGIDLNIEFDDRFPRQSLVVEHKGEDITLLMDPQELFRMQNEAERLISWERASDD